jgi:hypothetical protein
LKSALEINHGKISNPLLRKDEKNSDQSLRSIHAESAPKLYNHHSSKNISQPSFIEVLDEVRLRNEMAENEKEKKNLIVFCYVIVILNVLCLVGGFAV